MRTWISAASGRSCRWEPEKGERARGRGFMENPRPLFRGAPRRAPAIPPAPSADAGPGGIGKGRIPDRAAVQPVAQRLQPRAPADVLLHLGGWHPLHPGNLPRGGGEGAADQSGCEEELDEV